MNEKFSKGRGFHKVESRTRVLVSLRLILHLYVKRWLPLGIILPGEKKNQYSKTKTNLMIQLLDPTPSCAYCIRGLQQRDLNSC